MRKLPAYKLKKVLEGNSLIGQLCACDMENFGDLLYPVIFQKLALKYGITAPIIPLSFMSGSATWAAGYDVHGINELIQSPGRSFCPIWSSVVEMFCESMWRRLPHITAQPMKNISANISGRG